MISYLWIQNSYHLDILLTKSLHYEYKILGDINASDNIEFIRQKYIELLNIKQQRQIEKNEIIRSTMRLSGIALLFLLLNLVISIVELYKRKTRHDTGYR